MVIQLPNTIINFNRLSNMYVKYILFDIKNILSLSTNYFLISIPVFRFVLHYSLTKNG